MPQLFPDDGQLPLDRSRMALLFLGDILVRVTFQPHFDDQPQGRIVSKLIESLPESFGLDDRLEWIGRGVRDLFETAPIRRRPTEAARVEDTSTPPDQPGQVPDLSPRLVRRDRDEQLP